MSIINEKIQSWVPFCYRFTDGPPYIEHIITFKCPHCGSRNCQKKPGSVDFDNFWSGHFVCSDCGATHGTDGKVFNYYHSCFSHGIIRKPKQLTLF